MTERQHFESERHALYAGYVAGTLMLEGVPFTIVDDGEGNYTPQIVLVLQGRELVLVIPPPPTNWRLLGD